MLRKLGVVVAWLLSVSVVLVAQRGPAGPLGPPQPLALTNATVVNVRTGQIVANATIVIRNRKIESVGTGAAPAGLRSVDLKGKYVFPGLMDAHTHLSNFESARRALLSGVTTVRSSGVSNYVDVGLRELARKDAIAGPDVLAAGYHVRPVIAEDAFFGDPSLVNLLGGVRTPADLVQIVRANLSHGVDWIKVLATDRAGLPDTDPRQQVFSEAQLRTVVEEAGTKRVPVQAHAHGDEGAMAAVRAGVRSIEHGTYLSDTTLTLMKEKGTFLVPTYTTTFDLVEPGGDYDNPVLHLRGVHMLAVQREMIRHAQKIGVKIVTGADTGYGPTSVTRISTEVVNFVDIGLSPLAALQSATIVAAELLGIEKQTGAIEAGLEADLIAVDGDPLQNVGVLRDPLLIVSNGHIALDRLTFGKTGS